MPAAVKAELKTRKAAAVALEQSKTLIGEEACQSDYFLTSEDRFLTLLELAITHIPAGGRVLDLGNAPGYLAIMLAEAGFDIDGVNLSDDWNSTYPDPKFIDQFKVIASDIEKAPLPYDDNSFDAIVFTEVLEHIAIQHPRKILPEFHRVLSDSGVIIFSTPNVCNVSNIISILQGNNIFWAPDIFYGSTDRHNREFTPKEVLHLFQEGGFEVSNFFGMNDHANWRSGSAHHIYSFQERSGSSDHALMRNTIVGVFRKA